MEMLFGDAVADHHDFVVFLQEKVGGERGDWGEEEGGSGREAPGEGFHSVDGLWRGCVGGETATLLSPRIGWWAIVLRKYRP